MESTRTPFEDGFYYSLPALEALTGKPISRLPVSIRILLESLLRSYDGKKVKEEDILHLANWSSQLPSKQEIPFLVSRVLLQDFTGVPLLADLAAMREAAALHQKDPTVIEPMVPVDLVIDHSVQVDRSGTDDALFFNLELEFQRNLERYEFLKWGQQGFKTFRVIPPGIGIVHQVNLEYLATLVTDKQINGTKIYYFDSLVGTDSHTTMIGGLGILGWGVGGIEAEAAMLGQPYFFQTPQVIGVHLLGSLQEEVTATDLTLCITEMLRQEQVVGQFVEFFGEGASSLSASDRATISNMAPEYGATIGLFPSDEKTLDYLKLTGRDPTRIEIIKRYLQAQKLFGIPKPGQIDFSKTLKLDLSSITPSVAGPKRPQDRVPLSSLKSSFHETLTLSSELGGYGKDEQKQVCVHSSGHFHQHEPHTMGGIRLLKEPISFSESEMITNRPFSQELVNPGYLQHLSCDIVLRHGSIVIAAITSCTNTSNPFVMIAAGLVAKKAVEKGLRVNPKVKTSLAPGSRAVTDYLQKADLQKYLDLLGFQLVAYGCTTCIGNSGPLDENIENAIKEHDLIAVSVLSGNRNFEARIHAAVKANFLMSPPLVVVFALAGRIDIDVSKEPIGHTQKGEPVFLKDLWPSFTEVEKILQICLSSSTFTKRYAHVLTDNPLWDQVSTKKGATYPWKETSTYIRQPPFFEDFSLSKKPLPSLRNMRALAILGDSVTTDHISPAGAFKPSSPAGEYLVNQGVLEADFNSYGSRRGNHHVMMRGTFANVRIRNYMLQGKEGGFTKLMPEKQEMTIFEACEIYQQRKTPLILFAGKDYGMGSSRDWAAKGTALLGVKVVVAESFERIHRSNLVGMGVLPLQFQEGTTLADLHLTGEEEFHLSPFDLPLKPGQQVLLQINQDRSIPLLCRLDTSMDVDYYLHGGILPYVLKQILEID